LTGLLFGSVAAMLQPNNHVPLREYSKAFGGLFAMRVVHDRILVAADARAVGLLFGAGEGLDKALEPSRADKMISHKAGHHTLFSSGTNSPYWRLVRKGTAPAFVMKNIRGGFPGVVALADRVGRGLAANGAEAPMDVNNVFMRYAMDITGVVGFGKDFGATAALAAAAADPATDSLFECLRDGMLELYRSATNPAQGLMFWNADHRAGVRAFATFKAHMRALVKEVKARGPPAPGDVSIAAHLLRLADPATGAPLDDELLAGEFSVYFAAGIESASNAMTWTTYLVSQHPGVEARLVAELDAEGLLATPTRPHPRPVSYADLARLPYLAAVCKEAMRVRPVASSGTTRRVKRDLTIGGYLIPAGATILCPFDAVHKLPGNWGPDAETFNPDRWAEPGAEFLPSDDGLLGAGASIEGDIHLAATGDVADVETRVRRFIPFSVGPRQCVGQSLARLMHDGGLAALYARFSFRLADKMGGAAGVEANEINRLTLQPGAGMWMHAEPRVPGGVPVYPPADERASAEVGLSVWAGGSARAPEE
jgi:fatty acid synthase